MNNVAYRMYAATEPCDRQDAVLNVRGWEILWTNGIGQEQRMLCMDHARAMIYATRYNGKIRSLVWGPE